MHSSAPTPSSPLLHDIFPLHLHLLPLPLSSIMRLPHPLLVPVPLRSMGGYRYIKNNKARVKKGILQNVTINYLSKKRSNVARTNVTGKVVLY